MLAGARHLKPSTSLCFDRIISCDRSSWRMMAYGNIHVLAMGQEQALSALPKVQVEALDSQEVNLLQLAGWKRHLNWRPS